VIAILGGLGAALAWAATTLCSARASRSIGSVQTLAWVMLVGLVPALVAVLVAGGGAPDGPEAGWLVLSGVGNVAGLGLVYAGMRRGKVGVIAPIASTEGAVAAVIAIALGEHLSPGVAAALAVAVAGVVLAAAAKGDEGRTAPAAIGFACCAALAFGASIYATGRVSQELSVAWALLPARAVGVVLVTLPLLVAQRLVVPRGATGGLVVATGLAEVAGFASYALGAQHGIAIAAVLASQFAALAAVGAVFLYNERLTRWQTAGIVLIAIAVAVLSVLRA
jgi:drug/metabolite transporter (DMT)-like permease